jgi:hypothetical protein
MFYGARAINSRLLIRHNKPINLSSNNHPLTITLSLLISFLIYHKHVGLIYNPHNLSTKIYNKKFQYIDLISVFFFGFIIAS